MKFFFVIFIILSSFIQKINATHIVGADLYYRCLTGNNYEITLKLYRDCQTGVAPFDNPLELFIFTSYNNRLFTTIKLAPDTTLVPIPWQNCVLNQPSLCMSEGTYKAIVNLPGVIRGYDIAWARCCRNISIDNLVNPLDRGITFLAHVPGIEVIPSGCNSMPVFRNRPTNFICAGRPFTYDFSATDFEGDSLVYALTRPYDGTNFQGLGVGGTGSGIPPNVYTNEPQYNPTSNPLGPPPYNPVPFAGGYAFNNPFGSNNAVIDPNTGLFTVTPNQPGIFVMAVSVFEFRNGVLLSENKRDIQVYVVNCIPPDSPLVIHHNFGTLPHNGDTLLINANQSFCYDFTVEDFGANTPNIQVQAISNSFGIGNFPPPAATMTLLGGTPLAGRICWYPSCSFDNQLIPLIISAKDANDCQNHNITYDTVWVKITAPDLPPPSVIIDLQGNTFSNDTIFAPISNNVCFHFTVKDTVNFGNLSYSYQIINGGSQQAQVSDVVANNDSITGKICWKPNCEALSDTVQLFVTGRNSALCPPKNITIDTIYIVLFTLPNPPPTIKHDLTGNIFTQDTIFATVDSAFCYTFQISDTLPASNLTYKYSIKRTNGLQYTGNQPNASTISQTDTSIVGKICWQPDCNYLNEKLLIAVEVWDSSTCELDYIIYDSVFVVIKTIPNPKPIISHDLSGNIVQNDTIQAVADSIFCFQFTIKDSLPASKISYTFSVQRLNGQNLNGNLPNLATNIKNDTLIQGNLCWAPSCTLRNETFAIIIQGKDSSTCALDYTIFDTIYVHIVQRELFAPTLTHNFGSLPFNQDTVTIVVKQQSCVNFTLTDIDSLVADLGFQVRVIQSDISNQIQTQLIGNVLLANICFTATCENLDQTIPFILEGFKVPICGDSLFIRDTIFIRTIQLQSLPPQIQLIPNIAFSGTQQISLEPGKQACVDAILTDPDAFALLDLKGLSNLFEENYGFGSHAISVDTITTNSTLQIRFCFSPNCYLKKSLEPIVICGYDTTNCNNPIPVCDSLMLEITDCGFLFPNVITPNGDGINDTFGPFDSEGMLTWKMIIYDRWGNPIFTSKEMERWDGKMPSGKEVTEGVYFFVIDYTRVHGTGPALHGRITQSFTLLR